MKIILSVQPIKFPLTGIGRYTYELARHLNYVSEIERITYYSGNRFLEKIPEKSYYEQASKAPRNHMGRIKRILSRSRLAVDIYQRVKSKTELDLFSNLHDHIYHGTNFYVPSFPGAKVVTIHDLSVFTMPQCHPYERVKRLSKEMEVSLNRADMIITDSEYVKKEIIAHWGLPEAKIGVVKLACGEDFYPRSSQDVQQTMDKYGLVYQGYTLYAGTIEPRKNLSNLVKAYQQLPLRVRNQYPLVLAGHNGWNNAEIFEQIERGQHQGWVKHLGFVPNDNLPHLFSAAKLFVFPSLYEGFGLPVLEAMASGIPTITSNKSSLPEVGGNAVLYAAPLDVDGMTNLLFKGLFHEDWREEAIQLGLNQANCFSWNRCAEETAAIYKLAFNKYS